MSDAADDVPLVSLEAATDHAWAAYHAGAWPEALRRWNDVAARWPGYAPARVHAATALWEDDQRDASLAAITRAAVEIPSDAQIQARLAETLFHLGRLDEAGRLLEHAVPRFPYNPELAIDDIRMAHVSKDDREVLRRARGVEKTHPDLLLSNDGIYHLLKEARSRLAVENTQAKDYG